MPDLAPFFLYLTDTHQAAEICGIPVGFLGAFGAYFLPLCWRISAGFFAQFPSSLLAHFVGFSWRIWLCIFLSTSLAHALAQSCSDFGVFLQVRKSGNSASLFRLSLRLGASFLGMNDGYKKHHKKKDAAIFFCVFVMLWMLWMP